MDITVSIPNGKTDDIVQAMATQPGWTPPPQGSTAAQTRDHIAAYFGNRWKDEIRSTLKRHRRQQSVRAAVTADQALPDPLA